MTHRGARADEDQQRLEVRAPGDPAAVQLVAEHRHELTPLVAAHLGSALARLVRAVHVREDADGPGSLRRAADRMHGDLAGAGYRPAAESAHPVSASKRCARSRSTATDIGSPMPPVTDGRAFTFTISEPILTSTTVRSPSGSSP